MTRRTTSWLLVTMTIAAAVVTAALLRETASRAEAPSASASPQPTSPAAHALPAASAAPETVEPSGGQKPGWSDPPPREVNGAALSRAVSRKARERQADCARRADEEPGPGCEGGPAAGSVEIDWNARKASP